MIVLKCLIVDDEPIARDILVRYCEQLPYLQVAAQAVNALDAKSCLQQLEIDLMFLDINMPVLDGLSFLKTLKHPPEIIFTTAYREYALDAFDLSAIDYLLKPVSLERFIIAVDKVMDKRIAGRPGMESAGSAVTVSQTGTDEYLFIKADGKIFRVSLDAILYAEASGNYTRIVGDRQTLLPTISFSAFEELLPVGRYIRVHRSYIINKSKIDHIEGNRVFVAGTEIPIGNNYKEAFLKELGFI